MASDDTWSVATGEDVGKPLIFRIRNKHPSFARKKAFPHLLTVSWQYECANDSGMPSAKLTTRMCQLEDLLEESFEAGISLLGSEVKSLRQGNAQLAEAWIRVAPDGAWLVGAHISHYVEANRQNHEPVRDRKLLLHRHELLKLHRAVRLRGMTVVPVKLYLKGSRIKLEIATARGKKLHDKRETLKQRDAQREMARARR